MGYSQVVKPHIMGTNAQDHEQVVFEHKNVIYGPNPQVRSITPKYEYLA